LTNELLERVFTAVRPADFIEEIWVRDIVDVIWSMLRWRRILAALLAEQMEQAVNDEAVEIVEVQAAELLEGPEKGEMDKLLDNNSESWEDRVAKYPRANDKFQELWSAAKSTLDMDLIQAGVLTGNWDTIERIETFIETAQQRFDEVIREMDRHRLVQKQFNSSQDLERATIQPKLIEGKTTTKKSRMASRRKIEANRVNAQASTGPKTAQGRARAARNAHRHGLSLSVISNPVFSEQVELLVR
jgi:hypothetical protein